MTEISDTVRTLISGLSSSETKEGSVETLPPKPDAKSPVDGAEQLLTAKEKMDNVLHFRKALEARVHREEFVPFAEIPDYLKKGIVATEDRRFYEHGAMDLIGVARAAFTNYLAGETLQGGSTITQQTVKNIFLSNDRTMTRKAEELALAVQLERNYSKEEILELYLNTITMVMVPTASRKPAAPTLAKRPRSSTSPSARCSPVSRRHRLPMTPSHTRRKAPSA